jgi:hypothetical protein
VLLDRRADVQKLVDGIARSGLWLDQDQDGMMRGNMIHRKQAADITAPYFNQKPELLRFVLTQPGRVKYTNLRLVPEDFAEIEEYGLRVGILNGKSHFNDYADTSFTPEGRNLEPWQWEAPQ